MKLEQKYFISTFPNDSKQKQKTIQKVNSVHRLAPSTLMSKSFQQSMYSSRVVIPSQKQYTFTRPVSSYSSKFVHDQILNPLQDEGRELQFMRDHLRAKYEEQLESLNIKWIEMKRKSRLRKIQLYNLTEDLKKSSKIIGKKVRLNSMFNTN